MDNNTKLLLFGAVAVLILYLFYTCKPDESFWGGYFPVPYAGQPVQAYGRSGYDAATDAPHMIVDLDACNISPYYCERCQGYRCCCK